MHPVMLLPAGADTQALRKALWHYRIGHRITDEADGQLLWVADPRQHEELRTLVSRWERGEPLILEATRPKRPPAAHSLAATLRQVPVTGLMIGVSLLVFALSGIFGDLLIVVLTIVPVAGRHRDGGASMAAVIACISALWLDAPDIQPDVGVVLRTANRAAARQ